MNQQILLLLFRTTSMAKFPMWTLDVASTRSRNTSVATNQDQQFPMWTPDFAGIHSRNTVAANQNQAFPM